MIRLVAIAALIFAGVADAKTPETLVKQGIGFANKGKWRQAAKLLAAAAPRVKEAKARAVAYKHLGLARWELGDKKGAEEAFRRALGADARVELDPNDEPPAVVVFFRAIREKVVPVTAPVPAPAEAFNAKAQRSKDARNETSSLGVSAPLRQVPAPAPAPATASAPAPASILASKPTWLIPPRSTRKWAWVTLGVSVLSLAVGAVLYFNPPSPSKASLDAYNGGVDSHNASLRAGGGLLIGGTLLSVASTTLFILHRDGRHRLSPP
ncbi:MAG: tetratricopeptide repeat protein [Deltaproteobacteria bacterium]|nr:tetratricopeptide repeat protein [Deltaproteobacteria bacterium]